MPTIDVDIDFEDFDLEDIVDYIVDNIGELDWESLEKLEKAIAGGGNPDPDVVSDSLKKDSLEKIATLPLEKLWEIEKAYNL